MDIFPSIVKNEQKQIDRAFQEKKEAVEKNALDVLNLLAERDLDLHEISLTLKVANDKLQQSCGKLKLSQVLG